MLLGSKETFLAQHTTAVSPLHDDTSNPFYEHSQFRLMTDILSRKHKHHLLLSVPYSNLISFVFLQAFLQHCQQKALSMQNTQMLFLNLDNAPVFEIKQLAIEKEFEQLRDALKNTKQTLLLVLSRPEILSKETKKSDERFLRRQLDSLIAHPNCRLIVLTNSKEQTLYRHLDDTFQTVDITEPDDALHLAILKHQCRDLEAYHHVHLHDELIATACRLSSRYLNASQPIEKALLLLDSSAAREAQLGETTLSTATLMNVLADWTNIPATHLDRTGFPHGEFTNHISQSLFGQEAAIALISQVFSHSNHHLIPHNGPFASFLFLGAAHSGKKTAASALCDFLFKSNLVYVAYPDHSCKTFNAIKTKQLNGKQTYSITELIQHIPYAIILFEDAEQLTENTLDALQEITHTGFYQDPQGTQHNFRQTILILNANISKESLAAFVITDESEEDTYTMDLMQLILHDQKNDARQNEPHSAADIVETMLPEISHRVPNSLLQQLHIIPFLPLNKSAIEKMIRHKLKLLGKELANSHGVDLGYAPEVIRYLTHEVTNTHPNHALNQLYFCVEQAMLGSEIKHRSNQLFLQLNETGHSLRCEWLTIPVREHAY